MNEGKGIIMLYYKDDTDYTVDSGPTGYWLCYKGKPVQLVHTLAGVLEAIKAHKEGLKNG